MLRDFRSIPPAPFIAPFQAPASEYSHIFYIMDMSTKNVFSDANTQAFVKHPPLNHHEPDISSTVKSVACGGREIGLLKSDRFLTGSKS